MAAMARSVECWLGWLQESVDRMSTSCRGGRFRPNGGCSDQGFKFAEAQQEFGGAQPVSAFEISSKRLKGKVRWFNATTGSGFVTPDNGDKNLFFHQSSLKSGGCDGYHSLNVSDSMEFEISADLDGRARAFDITASNCGAFIGSFDHEHSYKGGEDCCFTQHGFAQFVGEIGKKVARHGLAPNAIHMVCPARDLLGAAMEFAVVGKFFEEMSCSDDTSARGGSPVDVLGGCTRAAR